MLIDEDVQAQLKDEFKKLVNPVRLAVYSQTLQDPSSENTKRLVEELGALDSRLRIESYNFVLDKEKVESGQIARTPAVAILGEEKDFGIRMYGALSGYEFGTLIQTILDVSQGDSGLSVPTREALKGLSKDISIQVFSTPT